MAKKQFTDVLVIGSGAGGGVAAFKLAQAGLNVMILEKGDWIDRQVNPEDELAELYLERHRPSAEDDPTIVKSDGQLAASSSRIGQSFYVVGGGTTRYTATSWRYRREDFRKLSTYGAVAGSTVADWPITYEDLEPYYTEAELEIGVSGLPGIDPCEPPRSKNVLLPPLKGDAYQRRLEAAAKKLGWKPFPLPLAIHSQANERTSGAQCMQCGFCSGFPCRFRAKSSVDVVIFPRAELTKHFVLKTHAYATNIVLDEKHNKVKGVEYIDLKTGNKNFVGCNILMVGASAIQTARLLLNSHSSRFPKGIANSSGIVGQNLMFHLEAKASATFDDTFHQGFYKKIGVHDFYYPGKEDGFINHRSIQSGSKAPPISFANQMQGYGAELIANIQKSFLHTQEVQAIVEDLPQIENRIILSADKKDPWGMPSPEVHHKYHPADIKALESCFDKMKQLLEAAGGQNLKLPKAAAQNITDRYTWHIMGTTRMGADRQTSVVNKDCQSHDISNLFIVDGSPFPTSAGINPTLTIQALALRTADRIPSLVKEGRV